MSFRVVDENDFEKEFTRKLEGTLAKDEKKRAGKRLADLRKTIAEEGEQLRELGERLYRFQNQVRSLPSPRCG